MTGKEVQSLSYYGVAVFKRAMSLELKNRTRQTDNLQAKTIAGLVFQGATEHEWLERNFAVYNSLN